MHDADIEKVLGGNFMRVFRAIEEGKTGINP
jgi:hypothetical protein